MLSHLVIDRFEICLECISYYVVSLEMLQYGYVYMKMLVKLLTQNYLNVKQSNHTIFDILNLRHVQ